MRASLKAMFLKFRRFAPLSGIVLYFAWLGNALAAEAEHGHHALNWIDFAYRTVAFVIVVGVLIKLLAKPIASFLNSRREEIQRLLAELEARTAEVSSEHAQVQARLASLEEETKKIVGELIAEGEAEKEKIIQ
ncbi:MAG TPA: ATP synthase F0 subunit B, partial [Syntrophobacteraceae bacterium]|nr:ATP synthase F0 subunit B [Syntrophobacteraceae bacterium]